MTKKITFALIILLAFSLAVTAFKKDDKIENPVSVAGAVVTTPVADSAVEEVVASSFAIYENLNLSALKLNKDAFQLAIKGYEKLKAAGKIKNDLLTIVDFSQPSTSKRMYVIDMAEGKLLQHTLVAHGRNTGQLMATNFSNQPESYKSSLGFYVTSETYIGKHGLSLRLDGMERSINDNARARAIVIHGADYATEGFYKSTGYLGRSFGCPAVPTAISKTLINTIRDGSCLFIYSNDKNYKKQSKLVS